MRGIKQPQLRVVPKEDLWDLLEKAHNELSHARRDRMHNQLVSVLYYVQYSKNISHHRRINVTPYSVHFGRTPPDISVDMSLPRVAALPLETEDQLK